jgi:hypothetical protein
MAKDILTSLHGKRIGLDEDGNLIVAGVQVTDVGADAGAENGSTVTAVTAGDVVRKVTLTCTATPIAFADDPGVAQYGGVKVYDFPEGLLLHLGASIDGSLTLTEAAWSDTFDGDVALGTVVATTGATLVSTEADLMISNAMTQAVAQVAVCDAQSSATQVTESAALWADGTATAKDMYLNFVIDDDAAHTAGNGTFTGTITFAYLMLGNN